MFRSNKLAVFSRVIQDQAGFFVVFDEAHDNRECRSQKPFNVRACTIAHAKPNDLGWRAPENTSLLEIRVFGNYGEAIGLGIIPDCGIVRTAQPALMNVR